MKVKFITCIYSNLYGTNFGGRNDRNDHYKYSLLSILKITDADFVCYTCSSEYDSLRDFFYDKNKVDKKHLEIKIFDLENNSFKELLSKYKDSDKIKKSERCFEIQYMKFIWLTSEDMSYDYYYWIDAGLSFDGLIPQKYLNSYNGNKIGFNSPLFNNNFLKNLIAISKDKCVFISKENSKFFYSDTVDNKHYDRYDSSRHIIGGLFGGRKDIMLDIIKMFKYYLVKVTIEDKKLYYEEAIMSLMNCNHKELFITLNFDTWYHPDTDLYRSRVMKNFSKTDSKLLDELKNHKSFYQIIEELQ
jgi:hypothetical protein